MRLEEHEKEVEPKTTICFTWEKRNCSTNVEVVDRETDRIKEAIWIRKTPSTKNWLTLGGYRLSHRWNSVLATPSGEQ